MATIRGETRWYRFAAPDRRRPVLILTRDSALEFLGKVTVTPITSTIQDIPAEVVLGAADRMPRDCAVDMDRLQNVAKAKIGALVARSARRRWARFAPQLLFALGFHRA